MSNERLSDVLNYGDARLPEAFWDKCIPEPNSGCWLWLKLSPQGQGYGVFYSNQKRGRRAHRVSYEASRGPIPGGLVIDHLCRQRCCVNPAHLEAVTNRENVLRGTSPVALNAQKTHCVKGHELPTEPGRQNARHCRECNRLRNLHSNLNPARIEAKRKRGRLSEARRAARERDLLRAAIVWRRNASDEATAALVDAIDALPISDTLLSRLAGGA